MDRSFEHLRLVLLLSAALSGCGAEARDDGAIVDPVYWFRGPLYSAFDGVHPYAVTPQILAVAHPERAADPVLASSLRWEVDESFVAREAHPELPGAIELTTKRAGTTRVRVSLKTVSGASASDQTNLIIAQGNVRDWDAGDQRYRTGEPVSWTEPTPLAATADPLDGTCGLPATIEYPRSAACSGCHDDHDAMSAPATPTQTGNYTDEDLLNIVAAGAKPAGESFHNPYLRELPMADCVFKQFHAWQLAEQSEAERRGIVLKLRSIPPSGRELRDF